MLALSLGNQIQCFLFVNHIVRSLLAKILISFGISVDKTDYSPDVEFDDGLAAGGGFEETRSQGVNPYLHFV